MKRIAMVVLSSYPIDVRVRREAEALRDAEANIDVLCITQRGELIKENVNGINVFRLNLKRQRAGKFRYLLEYAQSCGCRGKYPYCRSVDKSQEKHRWFYRYGQTFS